MDFDFKIQCVEDYQKYINYLKSLSKNESVEHKARHVAILNTKQDVIAISMASIRKTAKQIFRNGYDWFLEYSLIQNYKDEYYEETLIQGLVIAEIKELQKQKELIFKWIEKIDNWSTCDSVVSTMKSLKNSKYKSELFNDYLDLCFSEKEFVSRFGIVTLMTCYLEEVFIDKILDMCKRVKSEHYYVKMAIAWLVSYAFMKFRDKTYAFLKNRCLDKFTQNKAISKCRDSFQVSEQDKEKLVSLRIK